MSGPYLANPSAEFSARRKLVSSQVAKHEPPHRPRAAPPPRVSTTCPRASEPSRVRARFGGAIPHEFGFEPKGAAKLVPAKVFAVPGRLSRDEYLSLPMVLMLADRTSGGSDATELGVRWMSLETLQAEVDKSKLLQEYDCDQVE